MVLRKLLVWIGVFVSDVKLSFQLGNHWDSHGNYLGHAHVTFISATHTFHFTTNTKSWSFTDILPHHYFYLLYREEHVIQSPQCPFILGKDFSNIPLSATLAGAPFQQHGQQVRKHKYHKLSQKYQKSQTLL